MSVRLKTCSPTSTTGQTRSRRRPRAPSRFLAISCCAVRTECSAGMPRTRRRRDGSWAHGSHYGQGFIAATIMNDATKYNDWFDSAMVSEPSFERPAHYLQHVSWELRKLV